MTRGAEKIGAVILCGGESRRMGRPKAWLPFGGVPLLVHAIEQLRAAIGPQAPIAVVAAPGQDLPALPVGVIVARDPIPGRGPLQGLAVGFRALPGWVDLAYACGTDAPFLRPGWIALLAQRIGEADIAIPEAEGFLHPLAALCRPAIAAEAAERLLAEGRSRILDLRDRLRVEIVTEGELRTVDPELLALRNLNTPEDYASALERRRAGGPE